MRTAAFTISFVCVRVYQANKRSADDLAKQAELAYQKANKMTATLANQAKGQKLLAQGRYEEAQARFEAALAEVLALEGSLSELDEEDRMHRYDNPHAVTHAAAANAAAATGTATAAEPPPAPGPAQQGGGLGGAGGKARAGKKGAAAFAFASACACEVEGCEEMGDGHARGGAGGGGGANGAVAAAETGGSEEPAASVSAADAWRTSDEDRAAKVQAEAAAAKAATCEHPAGCGCGQAEQAKPRPSASAKLPSKNDMNKMSRLIRIDCLAGKAQCEMLRRQFAQATETLKDVLLDDRRNVEAWTMRGKVRGRARGHCHCALPLATAHCAPWNVPCVVCCLRAVEYSVLCVVCCVVFGVPDTRMSHLSRCPAYPSRNTALPPATPHCVPPSRPVPRPTCSLGCRCWRSSTSAARKTSTPRTSPRRRSCWWWLNRSSSLWGARRTRSCGGNWRRWTRRRRPAAGRAAHWAARGGRRSRAARARQRPTEHPTEQP